MTDDLRPRDREFALVVAAVIAARDAALGTQALAAAAAGVDWNRVQRIARRHGLAPLVNAGLRRACPDIVPPEVFGALRDHVSRNGALSALLWGTLLQVLARLEDHSIGAVAYKGPAAALALYGHVGLRQFSDLDILVRPQDVWRAAAVIEREGFEPDLTVPEPLRARFIRDQYVLMFRRDGGRTLLELHWAVAPSAFGAPLDEVGLWSRARRCSLQGASVAIPSDEDQLVLTCVHAARHGWDKLEAVAGVAALAARPGLDWSCVRALASRMRSRRMVACGLQLAQGLFGVLVPLEDIPLARRSTLRRIVAAMAADDARVRPGWGLLLLQLRLKDTVGDGVRQCVRQLLTPTGDDRMAVPLPRPLSFAYPFVRAFRLVRKYAFTH